MGSTELVRLKQSFASLVQKAAPLQMPSFIVWLDVKLAEYKVNGYMTLGKF